MGRPSAMDRTAEVTRPISLPSAMTCAPAPGTRSPSSTSPRERAVDVAAVLHARHQSPGRYSSPWCSSRAPRGASRAGSRSRRRLAGYQGWPASTGAPRASRRPPAPRRPPRARPARAAACSAGTQQWKPGDGSLGAVDHAHRRAADGDLDVGIAARRSRVTPARPSSRPRAAAPARTGWRTPRPPTRSRPSPR